jgi:hypothetical protein
MKGLRSVLPMLVVLISALALVSPARAVETCHKVNAKGEGRITSQTPTTATTESQIIGGGLLHGTTQATLAFTSFDPSTGVATFDGTLVLTTEQGTLTLSVFNGVFNTQTGEFHNDSAVANGTDRFDGATGSIFFHGFVFPDGHFVDDALSGEVCVDMP